MAYPCGDWLLDWLNKVEAVMEQTLGGDSDMAEAVSSHFNGVHGKRLRPSLTLMSSAISGSLCDSTVQLAAGIELIHLATLVHDDIVDGAQLRRGHPTPNAIWGSGWAILTGDFIFARAYKLLSDMRNPDIVQVLSRAVSSMCEGEWDQLKSRYETNPSVERYVSRIANKTAAFMGCCCECGALASMASNDMVGRLRDYGINLGLAFQIMDDLLDFVGEAEAMGKPAFEDITSGVYTLPIIFALEEKRAELIPLLTECGTDAAAIEDVVKIVMSTEGVSRSMAKARYYSEMAFDCISDFPNSTAKTGMLMLSRYVCERTV